MLTWFKVWFPQKGHICLWRAASALFPLNYSSFKKKKTKMKLTSRHISWWLDFLLSIFYLHCLCRKYRANLRVKQIFIQIVDSLRNFHFDDEFFSPDWPCNQKTSWENSSIIFDKVNYNLTFLYQTVQKCLSHLSYLSYLSQ